MPFKNLDGLRRIGSRKFLALAKLVTDGFDGSLPSGLAAVADIPIKGEGIDVDFIAEIIASCCKIQS